MEISRPAWRVLRPVLLAAAAATSWIALSGPAASADSASGLEPLLNEVRSPVSALTSPVADRTASLLPPLRVEESSPLAAERPAGDLAAGLPTLQPVIGEATAGADNLLGSAPVLNDISPLPAVTVLIDPVVAAADSAVAGVAGTADAGVSAVVGTVSPIVHSVLEPVTEAVPPAPDGIATGARDAADGVGQATPGDGADSSSAPMAGTSAVGHADGPVMAEAPQDSAGDLAAAWPGPNTGVPGSGAGASPSPGGSAQPAWLSGYHFQRPTAPGSAAHGRVLQVPSPVSFDPGSSPD
ncbi:MAG TPA: hypothetical protein VFN00_05050 [Arthrobacter sp.]|nr:hypothetical protein [Arthrobacter sp.]